MTTTQAESTIPTGSWSVDPVHSSVGFSITHGLGTFRGGFNDFDVSLAEDGDAPRFKGTVRVDSVAIDQEDLRGHLLSPEFFDVDNHPEIGFESTGVRIDGDGLVVDGELTINGITKAVEARGEVKGPVEMPTGASGIAVNLDAVVDRRDYGLNWQMALPNGDDVLGYDVAISVHLELQGEE